jgi:MFS family permease
MLFWGMLMQGIALLFFAYASTLSHYIFLSVILGAGTALVYPTFLATVAENTHPQDRAKSLGIFRLWRDLGYAVGAIITGVLIDLFSIDVAILAIALLTILSALVIALRMKNKPITNS